MYCLCMKKMISPKDCSIFIWRLKVTETSTLSVKATFQLQIVMPVKLPMGEAEKT